MRESVAARRQRALQIVRRLAKLYPDAHCALHHENALQLLIATIPPLNAPMSASTW
jgi:endonuclease-3